MLRTISPSAVIQDLPPSVAAPASLNGDILAPTLRVAPAIAFYLMYPVGIVVFAVLPGLRAQPLQCVTFFDADHGDGGDRPLRDQVKGHLRTAGIAADGGAIRLFYMPRVSGLASTP